MDDRFEIQDSQYHEPYHYYMNLEPFSIHKVLGWGLEYFSYLNTINDILTKIPHDTLLDVGCGDGYVLNYLSKMNPNKRYLGIDLSEKAIKFADAFKNCDNVQFKVLNLKDVNEKFDCVLAIQVLEHIPDDQIRDFMDYLARVTNNLGFLIISVPTMNFPVTKKHYRHYTIEKILSEKPEGFSLTYFTYNFDSKSIFFKMLKFLLNNPLFIVKSSIVLRILMKMIKKNYLETTYDRGGYLVAMFKKERKE
jgi:2-polyprenyl-3-methyl-5-hydroxy-6-metoxy-1,4-benzoquinol methylase